MFKIDKYVRIVKNLPQVAQVRYVCCKDEGSAKDTCTRYQCLQPEEEDELDLEKLKRDNMHPILKTTCHKDPKYARNILFFICFPAIILLYFDCFVFNKEERLRPKFVKFSYMRIRRKPYPWDPERTLFHNPRYNALPDGYEFEVPEDEEIDPFCLVP